jgi:PIN domain nuclease of toxin-antitoxin system
MRVLLDTHTFLWWNLNAPQLSDRAREIISDGHNEIFLSAASAWEIAIKYSKGRLELPDTPDRFVASRLTLHRFSSLPIQISHAAQVYSLPHIHTDPFDRMLIIQSKLENLPILTTDAAIALYDVTIIW